MYENIKLEQILLHSKEGTIVHVVLHSHSIANGTFYLISRERNQPIKRSEFNGVLYNNR